MKILKTILVILFVGCVIYSCIRIYAETGSWVAGLFIGLIVLIVPPSYHYQQVQLNEQREMIKGISNNINTIIKIIDIKLG